jgi:hypothetical protein
VSGSNLKVRGKYDAAYHADVKRSANRATLVLNASAGYFMCGNHKQNIANSLCSLLPFNGPTQLAGCVNLQFDTSKFS